MVCAPFTNILQIDKQLDYDPLGTEAKKLKLSFAAFGFWARKQTVRHSGLGWQTEGAAACWEWPTETPAQFSVQCDECNGFFYSVAFQYQRRLRGES